MLIIPGLVILLGVTFCLSADEEIEEKKVIILMGAPGSGKGTQASCLSQETGLPHVSTGDLFRENIRNGTDLGNKAKTIIDRGDLPSDDLVLDMLFDRLAKADCKKGYILDGFPRRISQAEALDQRLGNSVKIHAINLNVKNETIIERISGRRLCRYCGSTYHKKFSPPAKEGVCDRCENELYQRQDDWPESVSQRLIAYDKETKPLEDYYEKKGLLKSINGEKSPDEVFQDLKKLLI